MEGHLQDFASLASLRNKVPNLPEFFRDFHLLIYLGTQTVQPMLDEELRPLLEAIRDEKTELVFDWAESSHWRNIEALIQNFDSPLLMGLADYPFHGQPYPDQEGIARVFPY